MFKIVQEYSVNGEFFEEQPGTRGDLYKIHRSHVQQMGRRATLTRYDDAACIKIIHGWPLPNISQLRASNKQRGDSYLVCRRHVNQEGRGTASNFVFELFENKRIILFTVLPGKLQ